eukprot:TRINITY_DN10337_c0_g1_i3.p1 TRINITY_DN10337_c0_g1~~TRINITY_DN10337_c0_g1_i3.p1  ORF type:complete len:230 (+),score=21.68 TRINITY_DN10337_c0_g1_i3:67-756(+)
MLRSSFGVRFSMGRAPAQYYKRTLVHQVVSGLSNVAQVKEIRNLECSFPAVRSEAPQLMLAKGSEDLGEPMEWDIRWSSSSWSVSLSVRGSQFGLGFSLNVRLHSFVLKGRVRVHLPLGGECNLSQVTVSFVELPVVDFRLDSEVAFGIVPLPVSSQIDAKLRSSISEWLTTEVVEPNRLSFTFDGLKPKEELSDADMRQAIMDAESVRRRIVSGSFSPIQLSKAANGC